MLKYPVILEPDDNDTILVSFPDFPEAHTYGKTEAEALSRAIEAIETVLIAYMADRRSIPAPSPYAETVFGGATCTDGSEDSALSSHARGRRQQN